MEKLRDKRLWGYVIYGLVMCAYVGTLSFEANRVLEIIGGICLIGIMFLREVIPAAKRMPLGETIVVLIGFLHAFIVMARDDLSLGIFDVMLACVLYAFARCFTNANRAELREIDELGIQLVSKKKEYEIAAVKTNKALDVWPTFVPAEEERFRAWADQKYHLSEKRAFLELHGVTSAVYQHLNDDMKDINPRAYEKEKFDSLLALITARKKEYLEIAKTEQFNSKSATVALSNRELLELLDEEHTFSDHDEVYLYTREFSIFGAINEFMSTFRPALARYITSQFSYAADRGYYEDKDALLNAVDMPWSKDDDAADKQTINDIKETLEKQYAQVAAGHKGEAVISTIVDMVSKVDASSQDIRGATLKVPGTNDLTENDIILVCSKGVYTIEVKNWNGDFIIGDDGIVDRDTGEKRKDNPIGQSKYHADVLRKILKGIVPEDAIHPSVFMVNRHCTISAPTATIPVYAYHSGDGVDDLLADIGESHADLDLSTREKAISAINSAKTADREYRYELPNYLQLKYKAEYMYAISEFYRDNHVLYYPHILNEITNKANGTAYSHYPTRESKMLSADDPGHLLPGDIEIGFAFPELGTIPSINIKYLMDFIEYFSDMADYSKKHAPKKQKKGGRYDDCR